MTVTISIRYILFLSTPSGWRATKEEYDTQLTDDISIHALRVEGDARGERGFDWGSEFLSTPSGWRATKAHGIAVAKSVISIHALRVEGDALGHGRALCAF